MSDKPRAERRRAPAETVPVEDPGHLRALAGPHDTHLAALEDVLNVRLEAPGGGVRISGAADDRARARLVLTQLRADVESGVALSADDCAAAARRIVDDGAAAEDGVVRIGAKSFRGRTDAQRRYLAALADETTPLVFGVGPAGTGKTFLAVVYGAALLAARKVERLVVARPAVEAGEKLGYLPGDLTEKVDPYMLPIWDALRESLGQRMVEKRREDGGIEVAPLAFMRGRTLRDAFVIVDEAQNATVSQMQMVLTRIGEGARMAVTGDPSQVDLPVARSTRDGRETERSGLAHALRILDGVEGVAAVRFTKTDVQRHPLVGRIIEAYARDADGARPAAKGRARAGAKGAVGS